jgi:hypothetical protein
MPHEHFEFFPGSRRKIELLDWRPLLNEQSEKRLRLDFLMFLTGQPPIGIPKFVAPSYEVMDKEGSAAKDTDLLVELEGVTVQAYSTESTEHPIVIETLGLNLQDQEKQLGAGRVMVTGATLRNFKLVRETRDKLALVCLKFSVTLKAEAGLVLWAYTYHGATFWAQFTETQPTIAKKKAAEEGTVQMKLAPEPFAKPDAPTPGEPVEQCEYVDAKAGERCIGKQYHDGDHDMRPVETPPDAPRKRSAGRGVN